MSFTKIRKRERKKQKLQGESKIYSRKSFMLFRFTYLLICGE